MGRLESVSSSDEDLVVIRRKFLHDIYSDGTGQVLNNNNIKDVRKSPVGNMGQRIRTNSVDLRVTPNVTIERPGMQVNDAAVPSGMFGLEVSSSNCSKRLVVEGVPLLVQRRPATPRREVAKMRRTS